MSRPSDETDNRRNSRQLISRCMISCFSGAFTQLALFIIPHLFPSLSFLSQFLLSVLVLGIAIGICQFVRRLLGIRASAPAFVFFHIIFVWVVYITVVRCAVSKVSSIVLNMELMILLIGFFRILASDPGFVGHDSPILEEGSISEDGHRLEELSSTETAIIFQNTIEPTSLASRRIRYCRSCKAYVMGFDHHCPAFGNCIGEKNYGLFMSLLVGFITTEASYAVLSYQWINSNLILKVRRSKIQHSLVMSTMNFSLLQVLWQINWRKYPEFHVIAQSSPDMRFRNPYNNGVFRNLTEFFLR